jgi:hypothetical protein
LECLVRRAKALCCATMALRTDHTWEKSSAQQTGEVLIWIVKGFECSMKSVHDAHSPEH